MKKYEYMIIGLDTDPFISEKITYNGVTKTVSLRKMSTSELNFLGENGWEAIAYDKTYGLLLKREKESCS